jgi:hypothetical protein
MDLPVLITPSGHPSGRRTCEAPLPPRHAGAGTAGLPGHAVASRMRTKEVSFVLCPRGRILSTRPRLSRFGGTGHVPAKCSRRPLLSPIFTDPFRSHREFKGFSGNEPPRDTVFFSEKYSICSIYFKCLSDKLGIERRLRILIRKIRNKATMGST